MLKVLLLILIFSGCSSFGILKALTVKYRFNNLHMAKELLFKIRNEIEFSEKDIYELSKDIEDTDGLGIMSYMSNKSFSPSENYGFAKEKLEKSLFFEKSDWQLLDSFFLSFGKTSSENQIILCKKNTELLEKKEKEAEDNYGKYSRLYSTSGVLVGLFLVIVLL